jgi:serine/threonine protein kinase
MCLSTVLTAPTVGKLPKWTAHSHEPKTVSGPPTQPISFPAPWIARAKFVSALIWDPCLLGHVREAQILCRRASRRASCQTAYLIEKKIAKTSYGSVYQCVVVRMRRIGDLNSCQPGEWTLTRERVALKCSAYEMFLKRGSSSDPLQGMFLPIALRAIIGNTSSPAHSNNRPLTNILAISYPEAACLQFLGKHSSHVLGCIEVLSDAAFLYLVTPFCPGGSLGSLVSASPCSGRTKGSDETTSNSNSKECVAGVPKALDDSQARSWFLQVLRALNHLQAKGVYHGNLTLSNVLFEDKDSLVLVGYSRALRVPYWDKSNFGCISDVSEGSDRLPIIRKDHRESQPFLDPEVVESTSGFDGFAADLWSAGVLLFVFLVGQLPFQLPNSSDRDYDEISKGRLQYLLPARFEKSISLEACDLLQSMLWRDPCKRLTLQQVMYHPWVLGPNA